MRDGLKCRANIIVEYLIWKNFILKVMNVYELNFDRALQNTRLGVETGGNENPDRWIGFGLSLAAKIIPKESEKTINPENPLW